MPSRVVAGPPRHIDELTALPIHYDKENLPPQVLQEVEVVYESEYSLDFQGRKHLDQESSVERFTFGAHEDMSTSYPDHFPMPGLESADTLRNFLHHHLQPFQTIDDYGFECDLSEIPNDHLPVLQAKMWAKTSNNRTPVEETSQRPSHAQILLAGHVAKISQLLEDKHVFVISENTKNESCNYLSDLEITPEKHDCHSKIVRVEPLVHWGTLTPAGPSQFALPFRRNGELMKRPVEHPGYTQLVKRLTIDAPAYCVDCLSYLWNKRAEAREVMRQVQGTSSRPHSRYIGDSPPIRPVLKPTRAASLSGHADTLAVGGAFGTTAGNITPAAGELQEYFGEPLPQFDGAFDRPEELHMGQSYGSDCGSEAIWASSGSEQPTKENTAHTKRLHGVESTTSSFHLATLTAESSSGDAATIAPLVRASSSTVTKTDTSEEKRETHSDITKENYNTQVKDMKTPPRAEERKFGRVLDSNAKALLVQVRRSPRNHKTKMIMSHEIRPAPIKPMQPLKPLQNTRAAPKNTKEIKKRKIAHVGEKPGKQGKTQNTAPKSFMSLHSTDTVSKETTLSQSQTQPISTMKLQSASKPDSTVQSCPPPKLVVHFTKRPTQPKIPDGVAEEEWEAFYTACPAPTSKICWCNKPASHGTFKKKDSPQIAQCSNPYCRIRWLHYACLNLSEKGKARFGTLLCSVCRVEQELTDRNQKSEWTVGKFMGVQPLFTKWDIEANMPELGGVIPRPNAYGVGLEVKLGPKYDKSIEETGTLGGLDRLGYPQSRPEMLEEAYMHAGAYAELLARRAEEEKDDEWEEELHAGEEGYDEDEEADTE